MNFFDFFDYKKPLTQEIIDNAKKIGIPYLIKMLSNIPDVFVIVEKEFNNKYYYNYPMDKFLIFVRNLLKYRDINPYQKGLYYFSKASKSKKLHKEFIEAYKHYLDYTLHYITEDEFEKILEEEFGGDLNAVMDLGKLKVKKGKGKTITQTIETDPEPEPEPSKEAEFDINNDLLLSLDIKEKKKEKETPKEYELYKPKILSYIDDEIDEDDENYNINEEAESDHIINRRLEIYQKFINIFFGYKEEQIPDIDEAKHVIYGNGFLFNIIGKYRKSSKKYIFISLTNISKKEFENGELLSLSKHKPIKKYLYKLSKQGFTFILFTPTPYNKKRDIMLENLNFYYNKIKKFYYSFEESKLLITDTTTIAYELGAFSVNPEIVSYIGDNRYVYAIDFSMKFRDIKETLSYRLGYLYKRTPRIIDISENIIFDESNLDVEEYYDDYIYVMTNKKYYGKNFELMDIYNSGGHFGYFYMIFRNKEEPKKKYIVECKINYVYGYYIENTNNEYTYAFTIEQEKTNKIIFNKEDFANLKQSVYYYKENQEVMEKYKDTMFDIEKYKYFDIHLSANKYLFKIKRDYFNLKGKQTDILPNIVYLDIETYNNGKNKEFFKMFLTSKPIEGQYIQPITAITLKYKCGETKETDMVCFYLHLEEETEYTKTRDDVRLIKCKDEVELLLKFIKQLHQYAPDIITGWNSYFDIWTIYERLKFLNLEKSLSPLGVVMMNIDDDFQSNKKRMGILGYASIDMIDMFKSIIPKQQPSMKLNYIAKTFINEGKVEYDGSLVDLYENNLSTFLEYNITDVDLLPKLDEALGMFEYAAETSSLNSCVLESTTKNTVVIWGGFQYYMKKHGRVVELPIIIKVDEHIKAAFVKEPPNAMLNWVIDLDFSSLYPNIMRTFNIGKDTLIFTLDPNVAYDFIFKRNEFLNLHKEVVLYNPATSERFKVESKELFRIFEDMIILPSGQIYIRHEKRLSALYLLMTIYLEERAKNKKLKKKYSDDPILKRKYDNKQLANKRSANSSYGACLDNKSDVFELNVGKSIPAMGSITIKFTIASVDFVMRRFYDWGFDKTFEYLKSISVEELLNHDDYNIFKSNADHIPKSDYVIYTDTDSVFIHLEKLLNKYGPKDGTEEEKITFLEDVVIPKIEYAINDIIFAELYRELYKIDKERFFLSLKQEWIAKKLLIKTKKKYILYIVSEERERKVKVEIKGLEIIKAISSEYLRSNVKDWIVKHILEPEELDTYLLQQAIDEVEADIMNLIEKRDTSILMTAPYRKDVETYEKGAPSHVKAIALWNAIADEEHKIEKGDRAYLVPFKGFVAELMSKEQQQKAMEFLNKHKTDLIAIPIVYKTIPEFIKLFPERIYFKCWQHDIQALLDFLPDMKLMLDPGNIKAKKTKVMNRASEMFSLDF